MVVRADRRVRELAWVVPDLLDIAVGQICKHLDLRLSPNTDIGPVEWLPSDVVARQLEARESTWLERPEHDWPEPEHIGLAVVQENRVGIDDINGVEFLARRMRHETGETEADSGVQHGDRIAQLACVDHLADCLEHPGGDVDCEDAPEARVEVLCHSTETAAKLEDGLGWICWAYVEEHLESTPSAVRKRLPRRYVGNGSFSKTPVLSPSNLIPLFPDMSEAGVRHGSRIVP